MQRNTPPRFRVAIACSKGTYVRSIIADVGTDLGVGAHMTELRRTRSGAFTLDQACDLDRMDNVRLVPMEQATRLPVVISPAELVPRIRSGLQLPPEMLSVPPEIYEKFQIFDEHSKLVAVAHVEDQRVHYDRVFAP
jgi:tRNA pseudouridine55 synthase